MNIAELARRVGCPLEELRLALPKLGFDIGSHAIKVDDHVAWKIVQNWSRLRREWEKIAAAEKPEEAVEEQVVAEKVKQIIKLPAVLTVRDFAVRLNLPTSRVISELMKNGILASLNERLDFSTASILAEDLGFVPEQENKGEENEEVVTDILQEELSKEKIDALQPRPPVVVVMGHVDHGKTKLLDAIRKTNVVASEAGGITQHIGAYQTLYKGKNITFIDTPGHEAFTTMRSRGARVADVAILVVAADDGVQPQTVEALKIIRAAKVPFLVAMNKIDKENADQEKVKSQLAQENVVSEQWGGQTPFVPISAKLGQGIDNLLETVLILAEMEKDKIKANPDSAALATVVESHLDSGEGAVATLLVQNGTLCRNDYLVFENTLFGRVKAMKYWNGVSVEKALPGTPVRVLGFKVVPSVGDMIRGNKKAEGLEKAKADFYRQAVKTVEPEETKSKKQEKQFFNMVLKADVQGSLEAIIASLEKMQHPEVEVKIVEKGVGAIGEADVSEAEAHGAVIYGFNVEPSEAAQSLAQTKGMEIKSFKIIYELLDDVKARLEEKLAPEIVRHPVGKAVILKVFRSEKTYAIAGARVEDGHLAAGVDFNLFRNDAIIGQGEISELQSGKQSAKEIKMGSECGLKISTRASVREGDIIEAFTEEKRPRKISF
ncbi:MAG: translation initiation factor IF-2 [bacterium]|nr:translation initiation factor IF-2 [bacterium]